MENNRSSRDSDVEYSYSEPEKQKVQQAKSAGEVVKREVRVLLNVKIPNEHNLMDMILKIWSTL